MNFDQFREFVGKEPGVQKALNKAAEAVPRSGAVTKSFDPVTTAAGMAGLVILFPVVKYIVTHIGLPWLHSVERYAELWRLRFERWIDEQYEKHEVDPEAAKASGEALRRELEATVDAESREAWERLLMLLSAGDAEPQE